MYQGCKQELLILSKLLKCNVHYIHVYQKLPLLTFVLLDKVLHLEIHPLVVPCISIHIQGLLNTLTFLQSWRYWIINSKE